MRRRILLVTLGVLVLMLILTSMWSSSNNTKRSKNMPASASRETWKYQFTTKEMMTIPTSQLFSGESIFQEQDDKRIIDYIWKHHYLVPPSEQPYYFVEKTDKNKDQSPGQSQFILSLLGNMSKGFFVEAGALQGEYMSNTLFMEQHLNWKGLLVEAGPRNYDKLKKKNRKAWISNTCLAVKPYPHKVNFFENDELGRMLDGSVQRKRVIKVQCMPLYSLLVAINVSTVDYFSLDVEGGELKVLKTIPFDKVFIRTLSVEFAHTHEGKKAIIEFMQGKGYKLVGEMIKHLVYDVFFIHQNYNNTLVPYLPINHTKLSHFP